MDGPEAWGAEEEVVVTVVVSVVTMLMVVGMVVFIVETVRKWGCFEWQ